MRYFGDIHPAVHSYRPLPPGLKRCVLDANVLLDAALIVDGAGALAISALGRRGIAFTTSERARAEALERVREYRNGLTSIEAIVERFIEANVCVSNEGNANDNLHDDHVICLAHEGDTCAITEDLPLIHRLNSLDMHGRTLREVLYDCVRPQPGFLTTIFGTGLGADGHIFVKADAHPDMCRDAREWNLFESQGFVRVAYDSARGAFVLFRGTRRTIEIPFVIESDRPFALCVSYSTGRKTSITLRVGWVGSQSDSIATVEIAALGAAPHPMIRWLNRFEKPEGWKGHLQVGTFAPNRLSKESWRASRELVGVAPSTLTADLSFAASLLCEVRGESCRRPRWEHVVELVRVGNPGFYPGRRVGERERKWFDHTPDVVR